jgi:lysophospholipase L1-like esterase
MIDFKIIKKNYKDNLLEITHNDFEKNQIVLVGDCVFKYLNIDDHFNELSIYNNAICGDTTELLLETLYKRVIKYKPKKVFISVGSHDIGFDNRKVKKIYTNLIEIVSEIQRRSADTTIVLLTILPVNIASMESINRDYVDSRDNFDINMLNYYIKNYCRKNRIQFIDAHKSLKNGIDQLDLKYTFDGYHLNETGNEKITKLVLETI